MQDLQLPILNSVLPSNEVQIARGVKQVMDSGQSCIGILGFSFKAGTDDLRESPMIEVIERLIGKGLRSSYLRSQREHRSPERRQSGVYSQSHTAHLAPHGSCDRRCSKFGHKPS